ncbi:PQQ-binding-like beta-propeller repeat protein [Saccharicrinis sp. FJH54]|uniref:outer membrane protein assembly factor BamB family protein n=1 Tax=Saccharicrinis sp. FJH54 TaxID=3344665 RepID=UPI0035D3F358
MDDNKKIKLAFNVALVAGIFTLVIALLFLINYINIKQNDPVDNQALEAMVQRLADEPGNDALISEIRNLDLLARKAYFTGQWQINTASWLLLLGAIITTIALRFYYSLTSKIGLPDPAEIKPSAARLMSTKWIAGLSAAIVILALLSSFGSRNYLAKYDQMKQTAVQDSVVQNDILVVDVNPVSDTKQPDTSQIIKETAQNQTAPDEPEVETRQKNNSVIQDIAVQSKVATMDKENTPQDNLKAEKPEAAALPTLNDIKKQQAYFRGYLGQGISYAKNIPESWNPESGDHIKWKTEIPLKGYNSPVIWDDKIYLTGADQSKRVVYCISRNDGKILWQHDADNIPGSPSKPPKTTDDTGLAAPTVATDGQRVYAIFGTGDILTFKSDGTRLWAKNLGVPDNHYGHSSSLICYGDKLFVQYDTNKGGRVLALSVFDGSVLWDTSRESHISWASPVLAGFNGKMQLILSSEPIVAGYDIENGKELWSVECMMGEVGPSVGIGEGLVFAANEYATLAAIDPVKKAIVWEDNEYLPEVSSPVSADGLLFIATSYGVFVCYDAKTGEKQWETEFNSGFYSSAMVVDHKIYIADMEGVVHIMKLSRQHEGIADISMGERLMATPAFMDGQIFLRTTGSLYCIE